MLKQPANSCTLRTDLLLPRR